MQTADTYGHGNWTTEKEAHDHNGTYMQVGVSRSCGKLTL